FAFVTTTCKSAKSNVGEYERGESLATRQVWGRWADTLVRCGPEERKGGLDMQRSVLALVLLGLLVVPAAQAQKGPFVGVNLGVSGATNTNYRNLVDLGAEGAPFGGYMFNDYIGAEAQLPFAFHLPDNSAHLGSQTTTVMGGTAGPRVW